MPTLGYDSSVPVSAKGHLQGGTSLAVRDGGAFFSQDGKLAVVHGLVQPTNVG